MTNSICSIELAVESHIDTLRIYLSELLQFPLSGEFYLDDKTWTKTYSYSVTGSNKSKQVDFQWTYCNYYALFNYYYGDVFRELANTVGFFPPGLNQGIIPSLLYSHSEYTEFGGGMGGGFQVYCDGQNLMSAGGGAGGGGTNSPDSSRSANFGSGAGAGIQITDASLIDNQRFVSMGGGCGCNTCESSATSSNVTVACGASADQDSMTLPTFRTHLQNVLSSHRWRDACKESITVYGGGGGGGGIARVGEPTISAGYGYSFLLTASAGNSKQQKRKNKPDHHKLLERIDTPPSIPAFLRAGSGSRDVSAGFSGLVGASVAACGGGYADWACVCAELKLRVDTCSRVRISPAHKKGEKKGEEDCEVVRLANATVHSMLSGSCGTERARVRDIEACPANRSVVYSRQYTTVSEATVFVNYLDGLRSSDAGSSMDEAWFARLGGFDPQYRETFAAASAANTTVLLGALGPAVNRDAEYVVAILATLALLVVFAFTCRSIVSRWLPLPASVRGYRQLP